MATNSILPESLTTIGNQAFEGCTSLNVKLPNNLNSIGSRAFYNTTSLKTFDIPESVKSIGSYAFYSSGNNVDKSAEEMPYDAEIEYLKGSRYQYIDTGITAKNTIGVELEVTILPSLNIWFGVRPTTSNNNTLGLQLQTYPNKFISLYNSRVSFTSEKALVEGQKVKIKCETGKVYIDDELIYTHSTSASVFDSTPHTMYLFTEQYLEKPTSETNNKTQIHSCKIYRTYDNLILADFIPVRVGNVGYMYDKVTKKLFENKGTDNFILGPDKIVYDRDVGSKLKLPNELTSLGENAFQNCKTLKHVSIPSSLVSIGNNTFAGCSNLSSIIDNRLSAQDITNTTFGSNKTESETTYTGYNTKGNNNLSIYYDSINYQEGNWFDILQNPDKCGFNLKFIDPENIKYCKVTLDVGDGILSTTQLDLIQGYKYGELPEPICPFKIPYFHGWYYKNENESEILVTKNSYVPNQDTITLYAHYSTEPLIKNQYEVILNDQWRESTKTNPDSNIYDGVYESFSNYNIGNKAAVMYIKISGYTSFTLYIRSYAESSYDYTVVFNLDVYTPTKPLTSNPSSSTTGVKAHTSGKQNSGTTIESYTKVEYTEIDGGEHYICIAYRKDGSVNSDDDRGYILIDKSSAESAEIDPRYVLTTTDQSTLQDEDATFVMATEI